jgi:serralysin
MAVSPPVVEQETISTPGEVDLFEVDLVGGEQYTIVVSGASSGGGSLPDPFVGLYDEDGIDLGYDNDSPELGFDPLLNYTVPTSGTYIVGVKDLGDETGDYTFMIDQAGSPVFEDLLA